ncbi:methyltransferase domain-containing protein [Labrys neptuniae]|uniref:class I SAM-dependent methyltransferase n=1 Tax=Labrys neptuniae TaxID=376174 RepID=UPI00288FAC41|nr:methyltransferase domain-containing protein [Labrys neptuniae]MDT3379897.1 methyltransferase domain-containing protein [Labrys neptuniae]
MTKVEPIRFVYRRKNPKEDRVMARSATLENLVSSQFGSQAAAYVASPVHARGEDLRLVADEIAATRPERVLDLGCGGGHVSFAAAPVATEVIAYDLSSEMLAAVAEEAAKRGFANIATHQGTVEQLPFADASFDMVLSRYSAHHWGDVPAALREAFRVLKPGGRLVMADAVAPVRTVCDTFLQAFEMLRDPSHVRDYSIREWQAMLAAAGFTVRATTPGHQPLEFSSWIARMRTPPVFVEAIRALQAAMSEEVRQHFAIEADGSFVLDNAVFVAQR